jgi:GNAT superfamily N-acetyltransferase
MDETERGDGDMYQSTPTLNGHASPIDRPVPPCPLTNDIVANAVEEVCVSFQRKASAWTFQLRDNGRSTQGNAPLWYIQASRPRENNGTTPSSSTSGHFDLSFTSTFYIAYSTWDGRILYVDEWDTDAHERIQKDAPRIITPVLASIALKLHCTRIVWQHYDDPATAATAPVEPEFLRGWLTLFWYPESFRRFHDLSLPPTETVSLDGDSLASLPLIMPSEAPDRVSMQHRIQFCLGHVNECRMNIPGSRLRVQLASVSSESPDANNLDLQEICRLVQGLADYEKEPDAVHIGSKHYELDGESLFFCLLLQQEQNSPAASSKDSEDSKYYTCGMAFCYLGQRHADNRNSSNGDASARSKVFLYLEDLFIEPQYRKCGGGLLLMQCLAAIATALDCSLIKWQALDWNTPALNFYQNRIGAVIQKGLHTSRYMGVEALETIANSRGASES